MSYRIHNLQEVLSQTQIVQRFQQIAQDLQRLQQQSFAQESEQRATEELEDVETTEEIENLIIRDDEESIARQQKQKKHGRRKKDEKEKTPEKRLNPPGEGNIIDVTI